MEKDFKGFHIITAIMLCLLLLFLTFLTSNPMILVAIFIIILSVFLSSSNMKNFRKGMVYFIPIFIITLIINMFFASEGKTVIFTFLAKNFTFEALIYTSIFSLKLFLVIYIFLMADIMIDSDRASAYFSSIMPKSTLMLMVGFKLIPNMHQRFKNLKEIYAIRGVDFESKKLKDKIKSYIPVLSVLLETSLDGAFDIGESVYIRGFLSGKRSIYDKQIFKMKDYMLNASFGIALFIYFVIKYKRFDRFDIYTDLSINAFFNKVIFVYSLLLLLILILLLLFAEENDHGIYKD